MGEEDINGTKIKLYSSDLSKRLFFIDAETFAALKANNMSVDEFADLLFSTIRELSISSIGIGGSELYSGLTDNAKGLLSKLLKISIRDIACMLSKNYLYYKLLKLDIQENSSIASALSDRWFYNIKIIDSLERIEIDKNYEVDINLLDTYETYELRTKKENRVFKNTNGVVYLLTSEEIKSLALDNKETINYFYEDMLKIFNIILTDKELYTSDLFCKYLDI